jgi:hypothetical protein
MIISHKYKFIFIKTRKTAGSSIEYNLSSYLGEKDVITPLDGIPKAEKHLSKNYLIDTILSNFFKKIGLFKISKFFLYEIKPHEYAYSVKKIVGEKIWNTYYKFCVEREPVDKCLSYYFMRKNSPTSSKKRKQMTWPHFVKKKNFPIDYNFYIHNNELIVDRIINYENLNAELNEIFNYLNLPITKLKKKVNNTYRKPLDFEILDLERKLIYKAFKKTLPFTGYNIK